MFGSMDVLDGGDAFPSDRCEGFLRLGNRHLTENGLCHQWLIRQSADAHVLGLARGLGLASAQFRDLGGRVVRPAIVAGSIDGTASSFHHGELVYIDHTAVPKADNGFRSALTVTSEAGARVVVSLVSRFVRWNGPSNAQLVRSEVSTDEVAKVKIGSGFGSPAMQVTGLDDIETSEFTVRICPETHLNCYGLMSFSAFATCFSQSERASSNIPLDGAAILSRNVLCRGNIDPGDHLDISSVSRPTMIDRVPAVVSKSWARRRSDGTLVAASLSARQAG